MKLSGTKLELKAELAVIFILGTIRLSVDQVAIAASANSPELWNNGQLNGWTNEIFSTVDNPDTYLRISFPKQSIIMPSEEEVVGGLDASGGIFSGDYLSAGISNILFSIMTDGQRPKIIRLVLYSAASGREWSNAGIQLSDEAGQWITNNITLDYPGGTWKLAGPGATHEDFLADLKSVDRIGVRIQQNGTNAQSYCIDNFCLHGPNVCESIKGKVTYTGFQSGNVKIVGCNKPDGWAGQSMELPQPGNYELSNLPTVSNYWIRAFIDANTNGILDEWEPAGEYVNNPVKLMAPVENADVLLSEPSNAEGFPVWWINKYFDTDMVPLKTADTDGDGMNDWNEYIAGTDPRNCASVFKINMGTSHLKSSIVLKWVSNYANQMFAVLRTSNLMEGFVPIQNGIQATPPETFFEDTTANGTGPYYYKIQVEQ